MKMTVREIVKKYLEENGFDGLYSDNRSYDNVGCACSLKNLFYGCLYNNLDCKVGRKKKYASHIIPDDIDVNGYIG